MAMAMRKRIIAVIMAGIMMISAGVVLSGCNDNTKATITMPANENRPKKSDFSIHEPLLDKINIHMEKELRSSDFEFKYVEEFAKNQVTYIIVYESISNDPVFMKPCSTKLLFEYVKVENYILKYVTMETESTMCDSYYSGKKYMEFLAMRSGYEDATKTHIHTFYTGENADMFCVHLKGNYNRDNPERD